MGKRCCLSGVMWHLPFRRLTSPIQLIPTQRPFREMVRFAEKPRSSTFGAFLFSGSCTSERGKPCAIVVGDHNQSEGAQGAFFTSAPQDHHKTPETSCFFRFSPWDCLGFARIAHTRARVVLRSSFDRFSPSRVRSCYF